MAEYLQCIFKVIGRGFELPIPPIGISYDELISQDPIEITTGTTDSQLTFGGVGTVDVFALISDQPITVNLEADTGTDITVDANKPLLIIGGNITAAYVSNSSGSTASIRYWAFGT